MKDTPNPRKVIAGIAAISLLAIGVARSQEAAKKPEISAQAARLHRQALVVDTHDDTPQRFLFEKGFDFSKRNSTGHVDIPRARDGGLDAIFFSIWTSSDYYGPKAVKRSLDLIDTVYEQVRKHPREMMLATTAAGVRRAQREQKVAAMMGMEGGHMIDDDIRVLRMYAALGVRYLTLTHFKNNNWADSSTASEKPNQHNGLTPFGKDVVRELNRLGVMVDISHVSDKTFYDALEITKAPVMASHSSCRAISNHPRNMSDDMIRALAKNGGVIHINFHVTFLDQAYYDAEMAMGRELVKAFEELERACGEDTACQIQLSEKMHREATAAGKLPRVSWTKIVEHIDHVVKLVGADYVGLGSDFDGANMPEGMDDATFLPRITQALLQKGYSESDIAKILGGNTLRVMEQVERVAREMNQPAATGR